MLKKLLVALVASAFALGAYAQAPKSDTKTDAKGETATKTEKKAKTAKAEKKAKTAKAEKKSDTSKAKAKSDVKSEAKTDAPKEKAGK